MGTPKLRRDECVGVRTPNPKTTELIAVQPQPSGTIHPDAVASSLDETFHVLTAPTTVQSPLVEQAGSHPFIEGLVGVYGHHQEIQAMRGMRHAVVYPGSPA